LFWGKHGRNYNRPKGSPAGLCQNITCTGLSDDDHAQYIKHSLAKAANDFLVASGADTFIKEMLAEVKTAIGLYRFFVPWVFYIDP